MSGDPAASGSRPTPPEFLARVLPPATVARPRITLTWAQSLDAKIAGPNGARVNISGPESMLMTHWMRSMHASILIGINTLLNDDPRLQINLLPSDDLTLANPQPVVLDSKCRFSHRARMLQAYTEDKAQPRSETRRVKQPVVIVDSEAPSDRVHDLEKRGVHVVRSPPGPAGHVDPHDLPPILTELGLESVMIEGGSAVLSSFLKAGPRADGTPLVDIVIITVAPMLIGEGYGFVPLGHEHLLPQLVPVHTEIMGKDTVIVCKVVPRDHS